MNTLADLEPTDRHLLMDLIAQAGFDVTDWANYKKGSTMPAANPRYCYKWAFLDPGRLALLNIWLDDMEEDGDRVFFRRNMRRVAEGLGAGPKGRGREFSRIVGQAFEDQLPVRVVVLAGEEDPKTRVRRVTRRRLDNAIWRVTKFDSATGDNLIVRGAGTSKFADQFSASDGGAESPERRPTTGYEYPRSRVVRGIVLEAADGVCERCGKEGFKMWDGRVYLETHHVQPLSEGGVDAESNVVALCPDCHKRAHFAVDRDSIRSALHVAAATRERRREQSAFREP